VRLFVALEIPSAVRDNLAAFMKELRAVDTASKSNARWVRPENHHVTLKFIGNIDDAKLDAIRSALSGVRSQQPVELRFRGAGFFPNERRPRVFWTGIEASPNLEPLASEIDAHLAKLGVPAETRAFAPHLTLARFEPPGISERLRAAIKENANRDFGSMRTNEFHLIQSKTRPTGAEYTRLWSFPFAKAEA
jgi:2'-5' RNA ligase